MASLYVFLAYNVSIRNNPANSAQYHRPRPLHIASHVFGCRPDLSQWLFYSIRSRFLKEQDTDAVPFRKHPNHIEAVNAVVRDWLNQTVLQHRPIILSTFSKLVIQRQPI